jgi:hypothetical protein
MTWPPQSPDLNPIEIVWDELDRRVKEKQPTSAQHIVEKAFQVKLVERMPKVCKAVIKAKGGYFEENQIYFGLTLLWLLDVSICVISLSSLLFYNVENSKNKEKPLNE